MNTIGSVVTLNEACEMLKEAGVDTALVDHWRKHDDLKSIRREFRRRFPEVFMEDA